MFYPQLTAIHEAAHAVLCVVLGGRSFAFVTIEPNAVHAGRVQYRRPFDWEADDRKKQALVSLAGPAATQMFAGIDELGEDDVTDRENVIALMDGMADSGDAAADLAWRWYEEASRLIAENVQAIQTVANELLLKGTLSERCVRRMVKRSR